MLDRRKGRDRRRNVERVLVVKCKPTPPLAAWEDSSKKGHPVYINKLALPVHSQVSYTKHVSGRRLPRLRKDLVQNDSAAWNLAFVHERNGTFPSGRSKDLVLEPRCRTLHQHMYALECRKVETHQVRDDEVDDVILEIRIVETQLRKQFKRSLLKETQIQ